MKIPCFINGRAADIDFNVPITAAPKPTDQPRSFDLFRLSKAKTTVDLSPNTLRAYNQRGLPFYRKGKVVFVSKSELDQFIRHPELYTKSG